MIDLHKLDKFRLKDREREFYGCTGDSGNGVFKVFVGGKSFRVIASKKIEIGPLKTGCAGGNGIIDLGAIRFPNEIASVRFCADFEIVEQEENDERSK